MLTKKGVDESPDNVKHERYIGQPVFQTHKNKVPKSWVHNGWVEEVWE